MDCFMFVQIVVLIPPINEWHRGIL